MCVQGVRAVLRTSCDRRATNSNSPQYLCSDPQEALGRLVALIYRVTAVQLGIATGLDCLADGVVSLDDPLVEIALPIAETLIQVLVCLRVGKCIVKRPGLEYHRRCSNEGGCGKDGEESGKLHFGGEDEKVGKGTLWVTRKTSECKVEE